MRTVDANHYVIDGLAPFPRHWTDGEGRPLRVLAGPAEGYLMVRFRRAMPFVITVADLLNASRRTHRFGPFTLKKARR